MKKIYKWAIGLLPITGLFIAACSSSTPAATPQEEMDENLVGMPNPAAVYCEGLGYSMENVTRDGGEDADCIFPDGSRCGQWDFLAGRCGQAFTFCETQGYEVEEGANIGTCKFVDGSTCDEFQYFSGDCSPGDGPGEFVEESVQILGISEARDYLAAYFSSQYGVEALEPWIEQDITPEDVVGASTIRFVSGPLTIVISAQAAAPAPAEYTIEEASNIANGFYWEGMLSFDGEITETRVIPSSSVLNEELARDAVMDYLIKTYDVPTYGEWINQGVSQTDADTTLIVFTSGSWIVEVEFAPAAPLVSSYWVSVDNLSEEIRWEGEVTSHGEFFEKKFSQ